MAPVSYTHLIGGIESGYRDYSAECGAFVRDDLRFAGAPDSLTMGGVAKPNDTSFSERNRTFTWKNTCLLYTSRCV